MLFSILQLIYLVIPVAAVYFSYKTYVLLKKEIDLRRSKEENENTN